MFLFLFTFSTWRYWRAFVVRARGAARRCVDTMIITQERFREQYHALRAAGLGGVGSGGGASGGVLLLVAPDCDALCAARLLLTLLKSDAVDVRAAAVAGYTGVRAEVAAAGSGVGAIVLINCGAVSKVDEMLSLGGSSGEPVPGPLIFILDSHRPIYHTNLRDTTGRVRVFAGLIPEDVPLDELPEAGDSELDDGEDDNDEAEEDNGEEDEESGDEDEEEDDENASGADSASEDFDDAAAAGGGTAAKRAKKRKLVKPGAQKRRRRGGDADDGDTSSSGSGSVAGGGGRQKTMEEMVAALRREKIRRHRDYYAVGNYTGYPSSFIAFHIAKEVGRSRNDMLWLAIVGLTDVRALSSCQYRSLPHRDAPTPPPLLTLTPTRTLDIPLRANQ